MDEEYHIVYSDSPEWGVVGQGLRDYNIQQAGEPNEKYLCFVLYTPDQTIGGGIIGETHWDWLLINLLWLKDGLRGRGYGQRLLALAEEEARHRGARHAYLDTFSFQAPEFYKKHGYQVFGILDDFPHGHQRYYLTKQL